MEGASRATHPRLTYFCVLYLSRGQILSLHALLVQSLIAMMLDNDQGLYYTNYGPADQGIMNKVGCRGRRAGKRAVEIYR